MTAPVACMCYRLVAMANGAGLPGSGRFVLPQKQVVSGTTADNDRDQGYLRISFRPFFGW